MEIKVYEIKDKLPEDGQECWVIHHVAQSRSFPVLQVFNEIDYCWDDADGDDYCFDVNDEDVWIALPTKYEMEEDLED